MCGAIAPSFPTDIPGVPSIPRRISQDKQGNLRKTEANPSAANARGGGVNTVGGGSLPGDGYTCGLWFLFHYLTG